MGSNIPDFFGEIFGKAFEKDTKEKAINDYIYGKINKEQLDERMKQLENLDT